MSTTTQTPRHTQTASHPEHTNGIRASAGADRAAEYGTPWRAPDAVEANPIGLDREVVEQILPKLDALQATMWTLYHQYQKHHWLVEGPQYMDLHRFFEACY